MAQYRAHCGECGYTSSWLAESHAQDVVVSHYQAKHPGIEPGGAVQIKKGNPEGIGWGGGCLIIVVLLILLSQCKGG